MTSRISRLILLLLFCVVTVGCDHTSKHFARTLLANRPPIGLPGGIGELTFAQNAGGHLSFGADWSTTARTVGFIIAPGMFLAGMMAFLVFRVTEQPRFIFLSIAIAGGAGNWLERIFRDGVVTDFLHLQVGWFRTGIFNLADVAISVGVVGFAASDIMSAANRRWRNKRP